MYRTRKGPISDSTAYVNNLSMRMGNGAVRYVAASVNDTSLVTTSQRSYMHIKSERVRPTWHACVQLRKEARLGNGINMASAMAIP